jgi:hypothetical protein
MVNYRGREVLTALDHGNTVSWVRVLLEARSSVYVKDLVICRSQIQGCIQKVQQIKPSINLYTIAGFEAFTAVMFQIQVFWVVTQCSVCGRIPSFQRFVLPPYSQCCLPPPED